MLDDNVSMNCEDVHDEGNTLNHWLSDKSQIK